MAVAFAEDSVEMPRFEIPSARSTGFGGSHIAFTDNVFSLLVNPAAIMRTRQRSVFAPSFTLLSPAKTIKLAGDIGKGSSIGSVIDNLNNPANPGKIPFGLAINEFPLSIAYVADGFGFGVWDRIFVNANLIGTTVEATVLADVIIPIGFAFKILDTGEHDVDAGVTVKIFGRGYGYKMVNTIEVFSDMDKLLDDLSAPVVMGGGFDLGFLYRWNIGLSAGLTFDDIYTHGGEIARIGSGNRKDDYYVPFSLNLGVAYDLKIANFWSGAPRLIANSGVTFAFDWRNFDLLFDTEDPYLRRNPALGIGLGLQFSFADIIQFRLGMNEMLPAFGLGFDLGAFELDFSYYGKELGLEPGQMPAAAMDLTIAIRPDAKSKNWPWTRTTLVEIISGWVEKAKQKAEASSREREETADTVSDIPAVDEPIGSGSSPSEPAESEPAALDDGPSEPAEPEPAASNDGPSQSAGQEPPDTEVPPEETLD